MRIGRFADGPVGGHRAPRDPTVAVEEAAEPDGVPDEVVAHLDAEHLRTRLERERDVTVAAHVHAGHAVDRGERARQHVDRRLAVEGRVAAPPRHERGFVEEQHQAGVGKRASTISSSATDHARATAPRAGTHAVRATPAACSATPSVSGPVTCAFTRTGARSARAATSRNASSPACAGREVALGGGVGVAERREGAVGADLDLGERDQPLRQHPFAGSRPGSWGTAGSSGRQRNTSSAAAIGSLWGRLPMPVATPGTSTGARRVGDMDRTLRSPGPRAPSGLVSPTTRTESRCLVLSSCGCCASRGSRCR